MTGRLTNFSRGSRTGLVPMSSDASFDLFLTNDPAIGIYFAGNTTLSTSLHLLCNRDPFVCFDIFEARVSAFVLFDAVKKL